MTTMDDIAAYLRTDQAELRRKVFDGGGAAAAAQIVRREFVARAYIAGFEMDEIGAYIDRSEIMLWHALRMVCVDKFGGHFGRGLDEIAFMLRRVPA